MDNSNIEGRILDLLSHVHPNGLTYSEICVKVGSTKKNKQSVSQYLAQACLEGKIVKEKKRYRPLPHPPRKKELMPN